MPGFLTSTAAQLVALLVGAGTVGAFGAALATWMMVRRHDRTLFGEDEVSIGLVDQVDANTETLEVHDQVLREEDHLDRRRTDGGDREESG